jgi:prepilin peptidase CpaA
LVQEEKIDVMITLAHLLVVISLIAASVSDLARRRIPNTVSLIIVAAFLISALAGLGLARLGWDVAVALAVFAGGAALFWCNWLGGGDVKLLAASALWIGAADTPRFLVLVALLGGVLALAVLMLRLAAHWSEGLAWCRSHIDSEEGLPYGVAIAAACLLIRPAFNATGA